MGFKGLKSSISGAFGANAAGSFGSAFSNFMIPSKTLKAPDEHLKDGARQQVVSKGMLKHFIQHYYNQHDALVGIDIIPGHIRLCQMVEENGSWKLTNLASVDIPGDNSTQDMYAHVGVYATKLKEVVKQARVTAKNAAVALPVSSSIIRTVTIPQMTEAEIEQAIAMGSFWENLIQLPGEVSDYSVFYEIVKHDEVNNTMDILFVGARIEDIGIYSRIVSEAGLNPAIIDVRCFALSNIFNINAHNIGNESPVVFLKFGPDENYVHIIDQGESFMYDVYISEEDRTTIMDHFNDVEILQRYANQARQIIATHESKQGTHKVKDIFVVSLMPSIGPFVNKLSSILSDYKVSECNFFDHINISERFMKRIEVEENRSAWAVAMGLAARRVDVFDEHKGESGADNVNLLPNSKEIKVTKRAKVVSLVSLVPIAIIFCLIALISYTSVLKENNVVTDELAALGEVDLVYDQKSKKLNELKKTAKQLVSLEAIKAEFASNQPMILAAYKYINAKMPEGLWLTELTFTSPNVITIQGNSVGDQNILALVKSLKESELFSMAALNTLQLNTQFEAEMVKAFTINAELVVPVKPAPDKKKEKKEGN